jgi:class 3 adenylate cyclase/tetratricopeptide (TPR) repeat protein
MKCPKCQFDNEKGSKYCNECGYQLSFVCPECGKINFNGSNFCSKCGRELERIDKQNRKAHETESERKHVTVLFSDLSGYTAMSEKLDPEEVKEITSRIFSEVSQVISKYEGFVEKFVGDAVMALFGVPKTHEDDPVRAIKAAREIHDIVAAISPEVEKRIGQPISMHTGINTGLVVTGEVDMVKGTHGVAGETINLASRLSSLAKVDEIIVGSDTYRQAEWHFTFETLEPTTVKGKAEPVKVFKVLTPKGRPDTIHRLSGVRADLIGRQVEMDRLQQAVEELRKGNGMIFSIWGDAGTGKSRLVEEFKATLEHKEIQWIEGHAYSYSQNIPYFPLIDLLNRVFQIEEGDPSEKVREKVESGIRNLVGEKEDVIPYIGSLYALIYPEIDHVSPEFWKSRLQDASLSILSALAQRAPTIFFLEDLQWADSSFVELLRLTLLEAQHPAIVLCVYRPVFRLFTSHQVSGMGKVYHEIRLQDLSVSEVKGMAKSLLMTKTIPSNLMQFIQEKVEGNPFYLEEVINSLIESESLLRDNSGWKLTRPIGESDIPSTVQGVISARIDRLEKNTKHVLQEASVIGRAFLYQILENITKLTEHIERCLTSLERFDLIRKWSLQPDLEYIFKHALTQEVVYSSLLRKERKDIHERIGLVMEKLFHDRCSEFYETLAFHFKQGRSLLKAVDYLMKSGAKSLKRYAVEESHQYYKEAYDILVNKPDKTREEELLLIDLLIEWAYVFYYRGDFEGLSSLLSTQENLAESLNDRSRLGMFYSWVGLTLCFETKFREAYRNMHKAVKLGEEIENQRIIGLACTWLPWICAELGLLNEAIKFGERALEIEKHFQFDHYLYYKTLGGMGYTYFYMGERQKAYETGKAIVKFGRKHSNIRSMVMGHFIMGCSALLDGDFISLDPFFSTFPKMILGQGYALSGQFQEAHDTSQEILDFSQGFGNKWLGSFGSVILGIVLITKGQMRQGLKMLEDELSASLENERRCFYAMLEHILGNVYLQIVQGEGKLSMPIMLKNIIFLIKNVPLASRKAEEHFNRAIEVAKEIGAKGTEGQAYLDLGSLHKTKKKTKQAHEYISEAIKLFEEIGSDGYFKKAKETLSSLG